MPICSCGNQYFVLFLLQSNAGGASKVAPHQMAIIANSLPNECRLFHNILYKSASLALNPLLSRYVTQTLRFSPSLPSIGDQTVRSRHGKRCLHQQNCLQNLQPECLTQTFWHKETGLTFASFFRFVNLILSICWILLGKDNDKPDIARTSMLLMKLMLDQQSVIEAPLRYWGIIECIEVLSSEARDVFHEYKLHLAHSGACQNHLKMGTGHWKRIFTCWRVKRRECLLPFVIDQLYWWW